MDLDQTEKRILDLLQKEDSMTFTQIEVSLGRSQVTSPTVSRRLKHLVRLGLIRREVSDSWPPKTRYMLNQKGDPSNNATIRSSQAATDAARSRVRKFFLKPILMFFIALPAYLIAGGILRFNLYLLIILAIAAGLYAGSVARSYSTSFVLCLGTSFIYLLVRGVVGFIIVLPALLADDMYWFTNAAMKEIADTVDAQIIVLPLLLLGAFLSQMIRELHGDTLARLYVRILPK